MIAEEIAPEGAPANDLPPQTAVFAPGPDPEMISEIAARLRKAAGLPASPTGVVANGREAQRRREVLASREGAEAQGRGRAQVTPAWAGGAKYSSRPTGSADLSGGRTRSA